MGLDMYLRGEKYLPQDWNDPTKDRREDGKRVSQVEVDLGYWRKHPDLHGYIVRTFANGVDECQRIELSVDDLKHLLERAEVDGWGEENSGFFFGQSPHPGDEWYQRKHDDTVKIFREAIAWLEAMSTPGSGCWPSVFYRASW
jgi:hypothetical protein